MKSAKENLYTALPVLGMTALILDTQTALSGAAAGLELCLRTVIPSLFPFLILSVLVTGNLAGRRISVLHPIGRLCRIPVGAEGLLAVGLIGGYPVGAQCVAQACRTGMLRREEAKRMLGFCSNAGPAFLFGMLCGVFTESRSLWALWGIHILSAIMTGILLPGGSFRTVDPQNIRPQTLTQALETSLKTISVICGWVILFRVMLAFYQRWFLWFFPDVVSVMISGFLELTNGCCGLQLAGHEGVRFLMAAAMLAFGGLCVCLQTLSVTEDTGAGMYLTGKLLQTAISIGLAYPIQGILFEPAQTVSLHPVPFLLCLLPVIWTLLKKFKLPSSILTRQGV